MIGICIKAGFTCPECESYVPMNAFVDRLRCPACGTEHTLTVEHWKTVLDDVIKEAPHLDEGEGSSSTIFGNENYRLEYGRLHPRYSETKDDIPVEEILKHLEDGYVSHPETGERTVVRKPPDLYNGEFSGMVALVGEEASLIPGLGDGTEVEVESSSHPVAMQCPKCGGSLIVSGNKRTETCRFCDTKVHLPDDLWKILHPIRKALRWFILNDYSNMPCSWESEVYGASAAGVDLCLALYNDYGDMPVLTRLRQDRTQCWMRDDLTIDCQLEGDTPGLVIDFNGNVLIMHENEKDLYSISLKDGSVTDMIEGKEPDGEMEAEKPAPFCMKDLEGMTCMPDASIVTVKCVSGENGYCRELQRFDLEGNPLPLWEPEDEANVDKPGFFSKIIGFFSGADSKPETPYFEDLGDRPLRLRDSGCELSAGPDGSLYILNSEKLASFDSRGIKRYTVEIPCQRIWGRPVADSTGAAYVLAESEGERYRVLKISAQGEISEYAASDVDGGPVENCETIALTSDGNIHVLGYGGKWTVIGKNS